MARLPDFLIVGAQKCGTTWLHHHLREHPSLFLPADKEQSYFCWSSGDHALTQEAYLEHFSAAAADQRVGEATAAYFWTDTQSPWEEKPPGYQSNIPRRIAQTLSRDAKFLLTLRDPAERAVSAYFHHVTLGAVAANCPLLETPRTLGIVDIGYFGRHLQNWLVAVSSNQMLIMDLATDIQDRPLETLSRVHALLGVESIAPEADPAHKIFAGTVRRSDADGIVGNEGVRVNSATLARLRALYRDDVHRLSEVSGRDFVALWGYP